MSNHAYCEYNCGGTSCDSPIRYTKKNYKLIYREWWQFWKPEYIVIYDDEQPKIKFVKLNLQYGGWPTSR